MRTARHALVTFATALGLVFAAPAFAGAMEGVLGTWSTADGHGVIAISVCGEAVCGRIVGIDRPPGAPIPTDVQGRSQCGLTILTKEQRRADGTWLGEITDPRNGNTYHAMLWLDDQGALHVRGYVGMPLLGATQTWHRFTGRVTGACELG